MKEQLFDFKNLKEEIKAQLDTANYCGDISDLGNEVGVVIAKHFDKDNSAEDFISGLRHGISLTDGTHGNGNPFL